jgi:hypothetical protein
MRVVSKRGGAKALKPLTSNRCSTSYCTRRKIGRLSWLSLAVAAGGIKLSLGYLVSGKVMAEECPLSAPLVLKDTQSGVAGETGNVWTIAPDCSFTVARQVGLNLLQPHKQGQLAPQQRLQLKQMMDRMAATALPQELGSGPQVNARRITLAYGGKQSVLTLPPGGGDLEALRGVASDDSTRRMLDLANDLKAMTGG